MKWRFKYQDLVMFGLELNKYKFYPLQVMENSNRLLDKG